MLKMCAAIHWAGITKIKPAARLNRKHDFSQGQATAAKWQEDYFFFTTKT